MTMLLQFLLLLLIATAFEYMFMEDVFYRVSVILTATSDL